MKIIDNVPCSSSYAFIILVCDLYSFVLPSRTSKPIPITVIYSVENNTLVSFQHITTLSFRSSHISIILELLMSISTFKIPNLSVIIFQDELPFQEVEK